MFATRSSRFVFVSFSPFGFRFVSLCYIGCYLLTHTTLRLFTPFADVQLREKTSYKQRELSSKGRTRTQARRDEEKGEHEEQAKQEQVEREFKSKKRERERGVGECPKGGSESKKKKREER